MSGRVCQCGSGSAIGIFPKQKFQKLINYYAVCNGLFPEDFYGNDVTEFNGTVEPLASPAMAIRVKDIAGVSKGMMIGNRKLTDSYLKLSVPVSDAHPTLPRHDLVIARMYKLKNEDGDDEVSSDDRREKITIAVKEGIAGVDPEAGVPAADINEGEIPLAKLRVNANADQITAADIIECRKFLELSCNHFKLIKEIKDQVDANSADIAQLQDDLNEHILNFNSHVIDYNTNINALNSSVQAAQDMITILQDQMTGVFSDIAAMNAILAEHGNNILAIQDSLSPTGEIGSIIYNNVTRLDFIEAQLVLILAADAALAADIAALQIITGNLGSDLSSLQTDVVDLSITVFNNFNILDSAIATLETDLLEHLNNHPAGGIWTVQEKTDALAQIEDNVQAIIDLSNAVPSSKIYPNDLADISSGDYTPFPAEGARAFGLNGTLSSALFEDTFDGPDVDAAKWDGQIVNAEIVDGKIENIVDNTPWRVCSAAQKFAAGDKKCAFRMYYETLGDGIPSHSKMRMLEVKLNPLGETSSKDMCGFSLGIGIFDNPVRYFGFNGPPGVHNNPYSWTSGNIDFTHPGHVAGNTYNYTDFEFEVVGNTFKLWIQPEGLDKLLAYEGEANLTMFADGDAGYTQLSDAFTSIGIGSYSYLNDDDRLCKIDSIEITAAGAGSIVYDAVGSIIFDPKDAEVVDNIQGFKINTDIILNGGTVTFDLSYDSGSSWDLDVDIDSDEITAQVHTASQVLIRVNLATPDTATTPIIRLFSFRSDDVAPLAAVATKINEILDAIDGAADFAAMKIAIAAIDNL